MKRINSLLIHVWCGILFAGTYDVQSVEISSTLTSITVRCQFDIESPAQRCSVHIRHRESNGTFILSLLRGYNEQVTVYRWLEVGSVHSLCV